MIRSLILDAGGVMVYPFHGYWDIPMSYRELMGDHAREVGSPAWIAALLLLSRPMDFGWYALLGLAAFPFSPMPFVGLFFLMGCMFVYSLVKGVREKRFAQHARA